MLLNSLPSSVTGIKIRIPSLGATSLSEQVLNDMGISYKDIENFFKFVVVTDILIKLDTTAKRLSSWLSIIDMDVNTRPVEISDDFRAPETSLMAYIASKLKVLPDDSSHLHPVQRVIRQMGTRVVDLLNSFSSSNISLDFLLSKDVQSILNFSLEKRAVIGPDQIGGLQDRRMIERSLRLLFRCNKSMENKGSSFTGRITGVTHL